MDLAKYRCLKCRQSRWAVYATLWRCEACGHRYPCVQGIPRLFSEEELSEQTRALRDDFYDGLVGSYYRFVMPFLTLPARPLRLSWVDWAVYSAVLAFILSIVIYLIIFFTERKISSFGGVDFFIAIIALCIALFFRRHPYLFFLFILAVPAKASLVLTRFKPDKTFAEVHQQVITKLKAKDGILKVLDISTGNCSSLYKHGWMELNAEYTGVDLSETMLMQGLAFMAGKRVPVDFALADAINLPFQSDTFDVVLNYGAVNGISNPALALGEMVRVAKKGALIVFLDEQLYPRASAIERVYFRKVLSSHNVIHECPIDLLPPGVADVEVNQVYQFYYICTAIKV